MLGDHIGFTSYGCATCGKLSREITTCDWCDQAVCFKREIQRVQLECYLWLASYDGPLAKVPHRVCVRCYEGDN